MIRFIIFLFFSGYLCNAHAQVTKGLTSIRDTSYSTYTAYQSTKKAFPDIRIVGEQPSKDVREERNLVYCTVGQRNLEIDAFLPRKKKQRKSPAVLLIHGGGWRTGNRTQHIPLAQRLAAAGFASFTVEYRLSTEALYPAAIYDLKAALRWLKANSEKFNIDTTKIAVLGFSAGGELAAFIGSTPNIAKFEGNGGHLKYSSSVQAIVDIDGTLSFVHPDSGEGDDTRAPSAATHWFGYAKKDNPSLWLEASPLTHAASNKAPILFLNSSVDRMHAGREDFRKILTDNNIYSEVHTFNGAPHSFCLFDPWFEPTVNYITVFLNKVFKK